MLWLDDATWGAFCAAAVARRAGAAGEITISRDRRRTVHAGVEVDTSWHVTAAGWTLHFTDSEWVAFAAGVREGEFDFAPSPPDGLRIRPRISATRRSST